MDTTNYEECERYETGSYQNHPVNFHGNTDAEKAQTLFNAARILNTGMFPERLNDLCTDLAELFKDVPCENGTTKKLGTITYHKCGMAYNSENSQLIMPPFEVETDDNSEGTDGNKNMNDRIALIRSVISCSYRWDGHFEQEQILMSISGKRPTGYEGAVARSLTKITKIVAKIEDQLKRNPNVDKGLVFANLYEKLEKEALRKCSYRNRDNENPNIPPQCEPTLKAVRYLEKDAIDQITELLLSSALDRERTMKILNYADDTNKTAYFVPMTSLLGDRAQELCTKELMNRLDAVVKDNLKNSLLVHDEDGEAFGYYGTRTVNDIIFCYAEALVRAKTCIVEPIYDAIEAYSMYDAIADETAREFFIKRGCLAKDWKPEPDLWLKAAKLLYPVCGEDSQIMSYARRLNLDDGVIAETIHIADEYVNEKLDEIAGTLSSKKMQKAKECLSEYVGPTNDYW